MPCSLARPLSWGTVSSSTSASGLAPIADAAPLSLCAREPHVPADRLVAEMVPPPRFDSVRFSTYIPDPNQPSQTEAVQVLEGFAAGLDGAGAAGGAKRGLFGFGKAKAKAAKAPAAPAASTWTAATASARPICSPPCGTPPRPSPRKRRSAPSSS